MQTFELHVFVDPINPDDAARDAFIEHVAKYNKSEKPRFLMKACVLGLRFRNGIGGFKNVYVLQTAMYFLAETLDEAINAIKEQRAFFEKYGPVLRLKIEGIVDKIDGCPETEAEAAERPDRYFEMHIKVYTSPDDSVETLREKARVFADDAAKTAPYPIPLSWNALRDKAYRDGRGHQVFLNARPRGVTIDGAKACRDDLIKRLRAAGFIVAETHLEYVLWDEDTLDPPMDKGWIDF